MIEVHKLNYSELDKLSRVWKKGISNDAIQAQFGKKGLEVQDKRSGKTYHFVYNKIFNGCNWSSAIGADKAFIWYTKSTSKRANEAKFLLSEFTKKSDRYIIDGYPFESNQISILGDDLLELKNLTSFMIDYAESLMEHLVEYGKGSLIVENTTANTLRLTDTTKMICIDGTCDKSTTTDHILNTEENKKEGKIMNKVTKIATETVEINKEAMVLAAKLEVGKVATAQLRKVVKPKLPMMVRGYADSPLFDIVLANAVGVALREYASENKKAQIVSEAMIQSAAVEMMSSFDLNGMIDEMLENVDVSKIVKLEDNKKEA